MEPKSSLPRSQQSATEHYPEPDESSPHRLTIFMIHFNIIHLHVRLCVPNGTIFSSLPLLTPSSFR